MLVGIALAAVVGISLNYVYLPIRAAQYPADQRGRADRVLQPGAEGRAQPGAVRQAGTWATARPTSPPSSGTSGSTARGSSPATGAGCTGIATALFTVLGVERPLGPVEVGPPSRASPGWRWLRHAVAGAGLLPELQVRLLQYPDQPSLPREVRERDYFFIGSFAVSGRSWPAASARSCSRSSTGFGSRRRPRPVGRGEPGLALAFVPLVRQPGHREPRPRDRGARLRRRPAPVGGAVRHPDHRGRQRHLPALVRAGGRGRPARRHAGQPLAHEHRLAPAPAAPAGDAGLRSESRGPIWRNVPVPPRPTSRCSA